MQHNPEFIESRSFTPALVELRGELSEGYIENKLQVLENTLPTYERGSPGSPGSGFHKFRTFSRKDLELHYESHTLGQQDTIGFFRYRSENYGQDLVYLEDEFRDAYVVEFDLVDIFWMGSIMIFQGDRGPVNSVIRVLQREIMDEIKIERIDLNPEIFFNFDEFGSSTGLRSGQSLSASAEGISTEVSKAQITGDLPATDFSERGKITHVFNRFEYLDYEILAHITKDRINVQSIKTAETDQNISKKSNVFISIELINELLEFNQSMSNKKGIR